MFSFLARLLGFDDTRLKSGQVAVDSARAARLPIRKETNEADGALRAPDARRRHTELALLSAFQKPACFKGPLARWDEEFRRQVLGDVIAKGELQLALDVDSLATAATAATLAEMLARHGLPTSGKKVVQAERLAAAIGVGAMQQEISAYMVTEAGGLALEAFKKQAEQAGAAIATRVIELLRSGDVVGAHRAAQQHEHEFPSLHTFSRASEELTIPANPRRDIASAEFALTHCPGIFAALDAEDLRWLQLSAAARFVGSNDAAKQAASQIRNVEFVARFGIERMRGIFLEQFSHQSHLDTFQKVQGLYVGLTVCMVTPCKACVPFDGMVFKVGEFDALPEFPRPDCETRGCQAIFKPIALTQSR